MRPCLVAKVGRFAGPLPLPSRRCYSAAMSTLMILSVAALLALLPGAVLPHRAAGERPAAFWWLLAVALSAMLAFGVAEFSGGWRTGFAAALWSSVAATLLVFTATAAFSRDAWRLSTLLYPYLMVLGLLATIWLNQPERPMEAAGAAVWINLHIIFALTTYALLTMAAVAGTAAYLQDRALKAKRPGRLAASLPSLLAAEAVEIRLLWYGAVLLAGGLATGMALEFFATGRVLVFDHKTVLSLLTFGVIVLLLIARQVSAVRGRRVARLVLVAYLLLTLAYPGVKFVTDVLIAG